MSGKKFKNCCINNPEYTNIQGNNGILRKYMGEFALQTLSSHVYTTYPKLLENVNVSNAAYHIYMMNKIKRLSFIENSIKVLDTHVEVQIKHGVTFINKIEIIKIPLHKNFVGYEFEGDKLFLMKNRYGGGLKIDILSLYMTYSAEPLKCKVLYIGQSYGKKGHRDTLIRLKSHEQLQKVMADVLFEDINSEIAITL